MPVYDYKCDRCGKTFDRFLPLQHYRTPQFCACGGSATKLLSAPAVMGDFQPYHCPITNKLIDGRRAHEENLKKHGCRVLEDGETTKQTNMVKAEDSKLEDLIANSAAEIVSTLPQETREQLGRELESGQTTTVVRQ